MRIGIIGCGYIGEKRALAALNNGVEVVNVYDTDMPRAKKLAERTRATATTTEDELIAAELDAIFICTVHAELARIAMKALAAGKHIFVEKPAGVNVSELAGIQKLAKQKGRVVKVGFNYRFHPSILKARDLIARGEIGDIMFLRARHGHGGRLGYEKEWRCDARISGGGELVDQGSHLIDLSNLFIDGLSLAYGNTPTYYWDTQVEDNVFLCLANTGGKLAWLSASWTEWKNIFSLEIYGQHGKLMIEGFGGSYGVEKLSFFKMLPQMGPPETVSWEYPGPDLSWDLELQAFKASIAGSEANGADIHDAMKVWQVIESIKSPKAAAA